MDIFEDVLFEKENPRRPRLFLPRIDTMDIWINQEFINRFRMSKASVGVLIQEIGLNLHRNTPQNHTLTPLTQILVALRFYVTGIMLNVAADFGGIDTSTASHVVRDVSREIARLLPMYIRMPMTNEELKETQTDFQNIANFPNVIGAVDCTHIRIQSPGGENAENFRNRKG
nr:putative nuclease HARBI1 [Leptinotarsa decemlineata]